MACRYILQMRSPFNPKFLNCNGLRSRAAGNPSRLDHREMLFRPAWHLLHLWIVNLKDNLWQEFNTFVRTEFSNIENKCTSLFDERNSLSFVLNTHSCFWLEMNPVWSLWSPDAVPELLEPNHLSILSCQTQHKTHENIGRDLSHSILCTSCHPRVVRNIKIRGSEMAQVCFSRGLAFVCDESISTRGSTDYVKYKSPSVLGCGVALI